MNQLTVYLASSSPRRREILTNLGYQVLCLKADIDETPFIAEKANDYVQRMAKMKNAAALNVWLQTHQQLPQYPVISADTTVSLNNQILGKPNDAVEAAHMLSLLSNKQHEVLTAIYINWKNQNYHALQVSTVTFAPLSAAQISAYIATGEPFDKAGSYGIQGLGGTFVEHVNGSFTGIMGLPVYETTALLSQCGWSPLTQIK